MSNVTQLPPGRGLGPPPEYFNAEQLQAWHDLVELLAPINRDALYRGPLEVMALCLWEFRTRGIDDHDKQAAFRAFLADFELGEDAIEKLGLPPFGPVHLLR